MAGQRFSSRLTAFISIVAGFLTSFVLTLALAPRAEAYIYWGGLPEMNRANLDGSGAQTLISEAYAGNGVAVDDEHIYWAASLYWLQGTENTIARANLDGTGADLSFITVAGPVGLFGPPLPGGVAVDDEHVYWAYSDWANPETAGIGRANLDGSGVDKNFIPGVAPRGLAVDDQHVYWANRATVQGEGVDGIGRANLDGTGVDQSFIGNMGVPFAVAVDDAHVYWTDLNAWTIGRANLDGSGVDRRFISAAHVAWVAVDTSHIYWTTSPSDLATTGLIWRANLDGFGAECLITGSDMGDLAVDALGPPPSAPPGCERPRPPEPSNEFSFGQAKKNKKKGTAKLTVKSLPGPGELELAKTKKVKGKEKTAEEAGKEKLAIKPKGKAKKKLNRKGKTKVKAKVTYTPDGGEPNTQSKKIKLIKR